jgi:heme/copper-type cytochrome/quinol oxidase subunit 2
VGGCESYSALFVIMIILIILAVLGIAFGVVWYIRRKKAQEGKGLRDSSDLAGKEPLAADKEDD